MLVVIAVRLILSAMATAWAGKTGRLLVGFIWDNNSIFLTSLTVLEAILSRHSGSTREKEQPYILPWIVEHSLIMHEFTFTLLPTEIYMPCVIHQLVNPLLFAYLAF